MKMRVIFALLCLIAFSAHAQVKLRYQIDKGDTVERTITASGEEQMNIDVNTLSGGIHALTYTLLDASGNASATQTRFFVKPKDNLFAHGPATLCYWVDNGAMQSQTVTGNGLQSIDYDANALSGGLHAFYYMLTDSLGKTAATQTRFFVKPKDNLFAHGPTTLYYWVDDGTKQKKTVATNGLINLDVNALAMQDGIHMLTYMLADSLGKTSATQTRMFVKQQAFAGGFAGYDYWVNSQTEQLVRTEFAIPRSAFTLDEAFTMPQLPFDGNRCDIYSDDDGISWACNADTLHLSFFTESGARFDTAFVYLDIRTAQPCLDEQATEHIADNFEGNLLLRRSLRPGSWNTLCLPFPMTRAEVRALWGNDTKLALLEGTEEWGTDEMKLVFSLTRGGIEANVPYLIQVEETMGDMHWMTNRAVVWQERPEVQAGAITFLGNYRSGVTVPEGDYYVSQDKFYRSKGLSTMLAYRGSFRDNAPLGSRRLSFYLRGEDDVVTRIDVPDVEGPNGKAYDLSGRQRDRQGKGILIYDGKKWMKKNR